MSVFAGPKIVGTPEGGNIIFGIDAGNTKSYPGSGTTILSSVQSQNASLGGGATFNSAGYFSFIDQVDDRITTSAINYPAAWSDPTTLEIWVYFDSDGVWSNGFAGSLFFVGSTAGGFGLIRSSIAERLAMWARPAGTGYQSFGFITGRDQWHHVVGTWDGATDVILYINGVGSAPAAVTVSSVPDVGGYTMGGTSATISTSAGNYMKGRVAIARMYNRALTAAEVLQNFNAHRGRFGL
jgi:hypothetical protein